VAADEALRTLVRRYLEGFIAGDVESLRPLFMARRLPRRTVAREAEKFAGWSLRDVGPVEVQDLGGGDLEVTLPRVALTDARGESRTTREVLIVRRTGEGEYRIASLRARQQRPRAGS
jgi:hypothetical protein